MLPPPEQSGNPLGDPLSVVSLWATAIGPGLGGCRDSGHMTGIYNLKSFWREDLDQNKEGDRTEG